MNAQHKSQILIVDDYPTNIKVLSDVLIDYGFEVLIARDGENALKKLQRITPDLILLDVLMPGIDGFETCRRIKERPSTCEIPIIFMTALADPVDKVKGLTLGAVDYITKPFQQEEVLARVNTHLKIRHLTKQLSDQNAQLQEEARSRQLAEQALRFSEEKFAKAFRSNPGPMMIVTLPDGRVLDLNQMFCCNLGYPPETVLNQLLQDLPLFVHANQREQLLTGLEDQKAIHNFECLLRTYTEEERYFLISAEVIQVRDLPCLLTMMLDITECKQAAAVMETAREAAELANQAKTQFLSNISHELRTPLNTMLGYTQLMARDTQLNTEQRQHLAIISQSGHHLLTLINDVLEITKIESGRVVLHQTTFELLKLLEDLYEMLLPKAQSKGLQLTFEVEIDEPIYIHTDEIKLRQILVNLVSNGLKFTDRGQVILRVQWVRLGTEDPGSQGAEVLGGKLLEGQSQEGGLGPSGSLEPESQGYVDATADSRQAGEARTVLLNFEVEDTGFGIAAHEIDCIFDPFYQTEAGLRNQEGTGLGLPISQRFAHLLGSELTVKSTVGVGSVFRFRLSVPLGEAGDVPPEPLNRRVVALTPGHPPYRVLVVEDQITNRQLLVKLLTSVGFEVREAVNGEEAIQTYQQWHPRVILMDARMPVMDGYEATRRIRAMEQGDLPTPVPTKIIALTANAFEEERQIALAAGCDDFVRKPIQEAALFSSIAAQIGVRYHYQEVPIAPNRATAGTLKSTPDNDPFPCLNDTVLQDLQDLADGDPAFLQDYLNLHLEQIPELMQALQTAIQQKDVAQISLTAHTLKGMGMTFEFNTVAEPSLAIEQMAAEGHPIPKEIGCQLASGVEQLLAAIRHTLSLDLL